MYYTIIKKLFKCDPTISYGLPYLISLKEHSMLFTKSEKLLKRDFKKILGIEINNKIQVACGERGIRIDSDRMLYGQQI